MAPKNILTTPTHTEPIEIPCDDNEVTIKNIKFRKRPATHWYNTRRKFTHLAQFVVDDEGKSVSYRQLIKNPKTRKTWEKGMCKELG